MTSTPAESRTPEAATTPPQAAGHLDLSFSENVLDKLLALTAVHGDAFRVYSPTIGRHVWVLSHPDHAKHVLVTHHGRYVKGVGIERVRILLGNGIMVSEADLWRSQRKLIQPAFHRAVIARMLDHIKRANGDLAARWRLAAAQGQAINLTQDMSEVTLEIVLRALFGARYGVLVSPSANPFSILTEETERNLTFAYRFRALSKLLQQEIDWRRQASYDDADLVSLLLAARDRKTSQPMADRQLLDEIMTLIVAGHETTASALNWLWYVLSRHDDVETRLHAEVREVDVSQAGIEAAARLPYTRAVIDETLRLYPPGWLLTRRSIEADAIGPYPLPADTDVLISPFLVHRHPAFWADAERFDPDRFATPSAGSDRYAYLPFGLGPRACIGEQFALIEMLLHVAALAREFHLELDDRGPVEMEPQVNLRTRHPLFMFPRLREPA